MRQKWLAEREQDWKRLEHLLNQSENGLQAIVPQEIKELGLLYRSIMNDLARLKDQPEHQHLLPYLNNLAQRCHGRIYASPPARISNILHFFLESFPQSFRRNFGFIYLAFMMFAIGTVLAMATVRLEPETASFFLPTSVIEEIRMTGQIWTEHKDAAFSESSYLMTNNIRVAINAYVTGAFLGIGTLLLMFHNGMFAFGGPLQVTIMYGVGDKLLLFVLPHGVIELTTIFIAGGAGMMMGYALLFPGELTRWEALRKKAWESMVLIMGCVPLLVVAGIIEGLVSLNPSVGTMPRILIAGASAVFLILYFGFSGRQEASK